MLKRCVVLFWMAAACSITITAQAQTSARPIKYETVHFARTYPCAPRSKQICLSVEVDYPAIVGAATAAAQNLINTSIQTHLFANADGSPGSTSGDGLAIQLQDEYQDMQRRVPEYHAPWFDHRSATVLMDSSAVFSVQMRLDQFVGGAHPNSVRVYLNFRPSGESLSLGDVLQEGRLAALTSLGDKHFREARKLQPGTDYKQAGFSFKDGRFALPENFGFSPEGMIFYFNSYDIAPYYFGPTELTIPYSELHDVLKPEFFPQMP